MTTRASGGRWGGVRRAATTRSTTIAAAAASRAAPSAHRLAADFPDGQITRLCGYLPLAIGMLARQLRRHPAWTAAGLAAGLAAARDRLALMHAENLSVAAAFDLSYADLTPAQQQLFRPLGLVPAPASTPTPPPPWTGSPCRTPAAALRSCTTSTCSPSPHPAVMCSMTWSASTPAPWPPPTIWSAQGEP